MTGGSITTRGENAKGIQVLYQSQTSTLESSGDVRVTVTDNAEIRTEYAGTGSSKSEGIGVQSSVLGDSDVFIMLDDAIISTQYHGVSASRNRGPGNIVIDVRDGSITTRRKNSNGISGFHDGVGDIVINTRNHAITSESTDLGASNDTFSLGIYGEHVGTGDVTIDLRGGSVMTKGIFSYGVYGRHQGDGVIKIDTRDLHAITTTGAMTATASWPTISGRWTTRSMAITVGGTIDASGAGAQGVRVGVAQPRRCPRSA